MSNLSKKCGKDVMLMVSYLNFPADPKEFYLLRVPGPFKTMTSFPNIRENSKEKADAVNRKFPIENS